MNYTKVELERDFVRDTSTNAVLNINKDEISAARKRKLLRKQKEQEFDNLKNDVTEMKSMLQKLIEGKDGSH
jgi:uncharacterized protein YpuA (DUF1002 family)